MRVSLREWIALAILAAYALLALTTQSGASVAGQGLDPVWAEAKQRGVLRVAVDLGFYPFTWVENEQPAGYDIELAQAVAAKLGLRAEFVPTGLDAIYDDLAARRADLAASALPYAPELGWRARFSSFYFNAGQVLIVPETSPISAADQLGGLRVGVPLGSDADTQARRMLAADPSIRLVSAYETPTDTLAALRRGELDAAIVDNTAALIDMNTAPGLKIATALTLELYVLAMAPQAFQLHAEVNRALDELRREGFFDALGRKWFVTLPDRPPQ